MIGEVGTGAVDFSHLENYVGGDQAVVREVLALFSDQARIVLPIFNPAGSDDDWRDAAHSLKGSALGIGAFALAEACNDAECARAASPEVKRAALARVAETLGGALADIAAYTRG
jgi:HPt (histidine-containing phosphotransfer) domain-containing protein